MLLAIAPPSLSAKLSITEYSDFINNDPYFPYNMCDLQRVLVG
jgi:hypothetical protein